MYPRFVQHAPVEFDLGLSDSFDHGMLLDADQARANQFTGNGQCRAVVKRAGERFQNFTTIAYWGY